MKNVFVDLQRLHPTHGILKSLVVTGLLLSSCQPQKNSKTLHDIAVGNGGMASCLGSIESEPSGTYILIPGKKKEPERYFNLIRCYLMDLAIAGLHYKGLAPIDFEDRDETKTSAFQHFARRSEEIVNAKLWQFPPGAREAVAHQLQAHFLIVPEFAAYLLSLIYKLNWRVTPMPVKAAHDEGDVPIENSQEYRLIPLANRHDTYVTISETISKLTYKVERKPYDSFNMLVEKFFGLDQYSNLAGLVYHEVLSYHAKEYMNFPDTEQVQRLVEFLWHHIFQLFSDGDYQEIHSYIEPLFSEKYGLSGEDKWDGFFVRQYDQEFKPIQLYRQFEKPKWLTFSQYLAAATWQPSCDATLEEFKRPYHVHLGETMIFEGQLAHLIRRGFSFEGSTFDGTFLTLKNVTIHKLSRLAGWFQDFPPDDEESIRNTICSKVDAHVEREVYQEFYGRLLDRAQTLADLDAIQEKMHNRCLSRRFSGARVSFLGSLQGHITAEDSKPYDDWLGTNRPRVLLDGYCSNGK